MKTKIALAVSAALFTYVANAEHQANNISQFTAKQSNQSHHPITLLKTHPIFKPEGNISTGKYRYFIQLENNPVALYDGGVKGYKATSSEKVNGIRSKLNVNSSNVKSYRHFLTSKQNDFLSKAQAQLGTITVEQQTTLAYNGLVLNITQEQAKKLARIDGVLHIQREILRYPATDAGPNIIKAPSVWSGEATGVESKGEGEIVGVIDSGVNTDNPSFAAIGGDGYQHVNPWGDGNYEGDCKVNFPELCNAKLIGVYSWPLVTDQYITHDVTVPANGEDHNGHGSHTASTTAGNILNNVPLKDVDGNDNGIVFEQISGVAPHANIVSYQVCTPGERDSINFGGCYPSLTILAVEDAIAKGIDVLNYSIGGGSSNPWDDPDALAFLAARRAGIHVAVAAGNGGPDASTVGSPADAPWLTGVAAYTHDRVFSGKSLTGFSGGDTAPPSDLTGEGRTGGFTGHIVYAGNYTDTNDPAGTLEQCLEPFPADTFKTGTIVVCDRGAIARVDKGRNVKAGGAEGLVLVNIDGGAPSVVADSHVIPAIHMNAEQGNILKEWLKTGQDHQATITASKPVSLKDENGNFVPVAAEFSSRGPNTSAPNIIVPSVAAPGVSIYAAYADSQSSGFKENPDPNDFSFLSGTSMASPHVAGALTLLAAIHPDWSPAEAQSALMLTANQNTVTSVGEPSDFFDMGSGFIDIEAASKSGLLLDESFTNYNLANPLFGGKPEAINMASMSNAACVDTCTWTRTFKATQDAAWAISPIVEDGLTLNVEPLAFVIKSGESQTITVTANITQADKGWDFANLELISGGIPTIRMPVAVKAAADNLPNTIQIDAPRNKGSISFTGYEIKGKANFTSNFHDKTTSIATDPLSKPLKQGETAVFEIVVAEKLNNAQFAVASTTSPDVDIAVYDSNGMLIGSSAGPDSNEVITFIDLPAGNYSFRVTNYQASSQGAVDDVSLSATTIKFDANSISSAMTTEMTSSQNDDSFSIAFNWDTTADLNGYVAIQETNGDLIKQIPTSLEHSTDVDIISPFTEGMMPGVSQFSGFEIDGNPTKQSRVYQLRESLPPNQEISDINYDGTLTGTVINWTFTKEAGDVEPTQVGFLFTPKKAGSKYGAKFEHLRNGDLVASTVTFSVKEAAPILKVTSPESVTAGESVVISTEGTVDPNGQKLSFVWEQIAGNQVSFVADSANLSFTAPNVSAGNEPLKFKVTVSDGRESASETVSIAVKPTVKHSSGGALGWLMLFMFPLAFLRRKK
ncbi:MAG: S8 family serine peptidase [Shewanella sp.]|nr:S8 family serine peptidase [Shewanella sp.]